MPQTTTKTIPETQRVTEDFRMNDKYYTVVFMVSSKNEDSFKQSAFYHSWQSLYNLSTIVAWQERWRFKIVLENCYGDTIKDISAEYNKKIEHLKLPYDNDMLAPGCFVFVKDTVSIEDLFFFSKLKHYHETMDIIGVTGILYSDDNKTVKHTYGYYITHIDSKSLYILDKGKKWSFVAKNKGPTPKRNLHEVSNKFMSVTFDTMYKNQQSFADNFANATDNNYDFSAFCASARLRDANICVAPIHLVIV